MHVAARTSKIRTGSIPAPVGGLNARDSIADMKPTDAVIMDNWVPGTTSVSIRNGYMAWVTGFANPVESLLTYQSATTAKMFAASGTSIYDVTISGAVGAAVVTGLSNARWQFANFGTPGGQFMYAVNGLNKPLLYDGSTWTPIDNGTGATISSITFVGTTATLTTATPHGLTTGRTVTVVGATPSAYNVTAKPITVTGANTFTYTMASTPATNATVVGTYTYGPAITGTDLSGNTVNPSNFKDVQIYAKRVWFTEKNSFRVWYLPVNSIAGAASLIDLSSLYFLGGSLQGMVVWTVASELGTTDYAAFVSSQGEVVVYSGIDPDTAGSFTLAGSFRIGKPVGQRFWNRVGTDTVLICEDGLLPISKAAFTNRQSQGDAISYKITNLINNTISLNKAIFGWQVMLYPLGNKIICNAPASQDNQTVQFVMNTLTNSWCRYTNLPARCFALFGDNPYFGGPTAVYKAETGTDDNGTAITTDVMPAYSYFASPGLQKLFTAVRPIVTVNGAFNPAIALSVDFSASTATSTPSLSFGTSAPPWNTTPWDSSPWSFPAMTTRDWQWLGGIGFAATMRMQALTRNITVEWSSTDFAWERSNGGVF
jgi:hypothetical protein